MRRPEPTRADLVSVAVMTSDEWREWQGPRTSASVEVVGPKLGYSYHYIIEQHGKTLCGRPEPRGGWLALDGDWISYWSGVRSGWCDRCFKIDQGPGGAKF